MSATATRRAMASVYIHEDGVPFLVAETPSEIAAIVREADLEELVELTLADPESWEPRPGSWAGKPLYVRAGKVNAISPPKNGAPQD